MIYNIVYIYRFNASIEIVGLVVGSQVVAFNK